MNIKKIGKLIGSLQLFSLILPLILHTHVSITVTAIEVTPDTVVEMDDVLLLNYTLWVDNEIDTQLDGTVYVHDPADSKVPSEINETFPEIHTPPNLGFMEALLGMKAGETKNVDIPFNSGKGFNNISYYLYGKDLFYRIYLKEILLDASKSPVTLFDLPFFIPLVILMISFIAFIIILRMQRYSRTHNILRLKTRCYSCKGLAKIKCGNSGCNTPYCKRCFVQNNGCTVCQSNTMIPLK
ncbi:MAG: hypothetical protein ACFE9L_04855 [Candidatus Hodarchaeota archaeon]